MLISRLWGDFAKDFMEYIASEFMLSLKWDKLCMTYKMLSIY